MGRCFRCGSVIPEEAPVLRESECERCSEDLHCCRNCRFYEPAVSNQCSEPLAEWVADKERSNFCEYFGLAEAPASRGGPFAEPATPRERWNRLFKDN
jgi:hypothetical protein